MTLGYRLDGPPDAPLLVLSPSLGTTTSLWEAQLDAFAELRLLRHDLPGHGESPLADRPVRVEGIARGVLALLDELGAERASFCGLSIGGMVGLWLGSHAPDRVARLVVCCTGARLGSPEHYRVRAERVRREGMGVAVQAGREVWFTPAFRETAEARRLFDELAACSPEGYAACCEAVAEWDFRGELGRVRPPTLALFGAEDAVTPSAVRDDLVGGIPDARSASIAGAAHLANVERPDAFARVVLGHLREGALA